MLIKIDAAGQSVQKLRREIVPSCLGKGNEIQFMLNGSIRKKPLFSQVQQTSAIPEDASHSSSWNFLVVRTLALLRTADVG